MCVGGGGGRPTGPLNHSVFNSFVLIHLAFILFLSNCSHICLLGSFVHSFVLIHLAFILFLSNCSHICLLGCKPFICSFFFVNRSFVHFFIFHFSFFIFFFFVNRSFVHSVVLIHLAFRLFLSNYSHICLLGCKLFICSIFFFLCSVTYWLVGTTVCITQSYLISYVRTP